MDMELAKARLVDPLILAAQFGLFELLFQFLDIAFRELGRSEHHEFNAGLLSHFEKGPVVGVRTGVPRGRVLAFQAARDAVEHGEVGRFEVFEDLALQGIEIQIHVSSQLSTVSRTPALPARSRAEGVRIVFGPI